MRKLATALMVLAGLTVATAAFAVDFNQKAALPQNLDLQFTLAATLVCDNGNASSGYYQEDIYRYGNLFSLGGGARLSTLAFVHYGFGFYGPYTYDIEMYDLASCTLVASVNGLTAQDAGDDLREEYVDLCPRNLILAGDVIVAIDANTCANPTDCYPDLIFDNQINVVCPYIIDPAGGICEDLSPQSGPFILRLEIDNCPVPAIPTTWGTVKGHYR